MRISPVNIGAAAAIFEALACLSILLSRVVFGVVLFFTGLGLLIFYRLSKDPLIEKPDVLGFINALIKAYDTLPMQKALDEALASSPKLQKIISPIMRAYKLGDRQAASKLEKLDGWLGNIGMIINRALLNGEDVHRDLLELHIDMLEDKKSNAKAYSHAKNASLMSILGMTVFIPVFSGISIGILTYAPAIGNISRISISSITLTFSAFIIIEAIARFTYSNTGDRKFSRIVTPFYCATGLLVLRMVSFLAINAI
jgi:hypothetical protein